jgi:hypothetical protein
MTPSVVLPSPRHNEVGHWKKISVLNGWPAHAAVNASPATLRAACTGCLVAPADASLAVIVVRYSFRCGGLAPLVSRRLLPAHCVCILKPQPIGWGLGIFFPFTKHLNQQNYGTISEITVRISPDINNRILAPRILFVVRFSLKSL